MSDFYERISKLSPKRLALLTMELQGRLEKAEKEAAGGGRTGPAKEPIAVIGMGCRLPGGANDPDTFWALLQNGVDAITEIPAERWDIDALYDPDPEAEGKMSTRWGGFISGIDEFDPAHFGITPREAATMDPQQRVMLETAWEALENAGYAPDALSGSATGVFVGVCNGDYYHMLMADLANNVDMYLATGNAHSVISGRISYLLGLQGPSVSLDTACSSSLVAIHQAIQSLRSGECHMAIAGGVNAILSPDTSVTLSKAKMMATDGRCKAFDDSADGFVRSEGSGVLVLKRLSDALADNDHIHAVIRASAINQDGRSNGLTAPNGPSQVAVIRAALAEAGLQPDEVTYVETHGTGTSLGDPIEAQALGAAYGAGRRPDNPLMIGSLKTNLGHMESAAGVGGLMKLILALQHGEIPPHLHLHHPSAHVRWDELPLTIPTRRTPWQPASGRRIGGVSSFGFSGTNVHMIVEEAADVEPFDNRSRAPLRAGSLTLNPSTSSGQAVERLTELLTLSARTETALRELARRYQRYFEAHPDISLADVCYTANSGRAKFAQRLALPAASPMEASGKLGAFSAHAEPEGLARGYYPAARSADVAFLFTGHGTQYPGMGRKLYETQPVFRRAIGTCAAALDGMLPVPLIEVLYGDDRRPQTTDDGHPSSVTGQDSAFILQPSSLSTMTLAQPALFAVEYALATLWQSWGVQPAAVMGHSLGEYAAAVIAGVFSLEDGCKLVATRGRLMDAAPETGQMAAVFADEATVAAAVAPYAARAALAVINGPSSIVISGANEAVETILDALAKTGVKSRKLAVAQAAHSPLVEPILDEFERVARTITFCAPKIELISCLTGKAVSAEEVTMPEYWRRHLRYTVRFSDAVQSLYSLGYRVFIETGPNPTLIGMAQRFLTGDGLTWAASLSEKQDDTLQMLESLGALFVNGVSVDWEAVAGETPHRRTPLPTYPFERQRYWMKRGKTGDRRRQTADGQQHRLVGERLQSPALSATVFENEIGVDWPAFLDHHRIYGAALLPSPAYVEMALEAAETVWGAGQRAVENLTIHEALILPEEGSQKVQFVLQAEEAGRAAFEVFTLAENGVWKKHAAGELLRSPAAPPAAVLDLPAVKARCAEEISGEAYYERLRELGLEFGEKFRGITRAWRRDGEALGRIELPEALLAESGQYHIHPAFLDACFHLLGAPLPGGKLETAYLLIGMEQFSLLKPPPARLWNHTTLSQQAAETFSGNVQLFDDDGTLVAEIRGLALKRASAEALLRAVKPRREDWVYAVEWAELTADRRPPTDIGRWQILTDSGGVGEALAGRIREAGGKCDVLPSPLAPLPGGEGNSALLPLGEGLGMRGVLVDLRALDGNTDALKLCAVALETAQKLPAGQRLWLVTRGAQAAGWRTVSQPEAATLWGLGRVLALEQPETWGGLIDLDPAASVENCAAQIFAALQNSADEDQIAFTNGQAFVPRLARTKIAPAYPPAIHKDAAYLVTGGLGGLGLMAARWLAGQGAGHIVLIGRRGVEQSQEPTTAEAIREVEALGAKVNVFSTDVADEGQMTALFQQFGAGLPPLKGILHTAAALSNYSIETLNAAALETMFRPKIAGTWLLHRLSEKLALDFFVLYSSTTALWGSSQLGHYAAANAFLDAFAHYRRGLGLPALSVNWGTWEVMRAASQAEQQMTAQFGLEQMPSTVALELLRGLLGAGPAQICLAAVNWSALKPAYEAKRKRPFLSNVDSLRPAARPLPEAKRAALFEAVKAASPEQRRAVILAFVRQAAAKVIGSDNPETVDVRQGLFEMGLDSLMSVELKSLLEAGVGKALPSTLTFNYPTVADLAEYLDTVALAEGGSQRSAVSSQPAAVGSQQGEQNAPQPDLDQASEDELAELLASKLAKLN